MVSVEFLLRQLIMIDYELLSAQIESLADKETNTIGILANATAIIRDATKWFWVGFYIVRDRKLELGPFQGSPACMSIPYGRGVCGKAWEKEKTLIVPDVEKFAGHIACSSLSRSEIVVPIHVGGRVWGVLDIDSTELDTFTTEDASGLQKICSILAKYLH